jgi:hypothetical protein
LIAFAEVITHVWRSPRANFHAAAWRMVAVVPSCNTAPEKSADTTPAPISARTLVTTAIRRNMP